MWGWSLGAMIALFLAPVIASAGYQSTTYGFSDITNHTAADAATAGQYGVTVFGTGSGDTSDVVNIGTTSNPVNVTVKSNQVLFLFKNSTLKASNVSEVYFQDGTL